MFAFSVSFILPISNWMSANEIAVLPLGTMPPMSSLFVLSYPFFKSFISEILSWSDEVFSLSEFNIISECVSAGKIWWPPVGIVGDFWFISTGSDFMFVTFFASLLDEESSICWERLLAAASMFGFSSPSMFSARFCGSFIAATPLSTSALLRSKWAEFESLTLSNFSTCAINCDRAESTSEFTVSCFCLFSLTAANRWS